MSRGLRGAWHDVAWCQKHLHIVDKGGVRRQLRYNPVQRKLNQIVLEEVIARRPIRLIVLKARQQGVSTWTQSIGYERTVRNPGHRALILSHDPAGTANLYGMYETFYNHDPKKLRTRSQSQKGIRFDEPHDGRIVVETAAKRNAGSGQTYQFCHFSEQAKWPFPSDTSLSVLQAIADAPDTMVVNESTGYGAGNHFHQEWLAAESGNSEWRPVFFAWFDNPEYSRHVRDDDDIDELGQKDQFQGPDFVGGVQYNFYPGEELDLIKRFNLDLAQLNWRRWTIRNKCNGNILLFRQEYPATPEEAFLSGGSPRFNVQTLMRWLEEECEDPQFVGRTELKIDQRDPSTELIGGDDNDWLRIWEMPIEGERYVLFADCAGSDPDGDHNAACIMRVSARPRWKQVATIHGLRGADLYARAIANLGAIYGMATVGVEVNGIGEACQSHLRHWYPESHLYHRLPVDKAKRRPQDRIGWYSGHVTRHNLIEDLDAAIRDETIELKCRDTVLELLDFQKVPGNRNGDHKPGGHDDRVFSVGGCLQIASYKVAGEYDHFTEERHVRSSAPMATEM